MKRERKLMRTIGLLVAAAIACVVFTSPLKAANSALYGKSVVVTWTENRIQRDSTTPNFYQNSFQGRLSVYVSAIGRVFSRQGMERRGGAGANYQIGDTARRRIGFQAHTMTVVELAAVSGARRIIVTFDQDFQNCTAEVIRAKQVGTDMIVSDSVISPGVRVEIKSVQVSGIGCSIQSGNVFGQAG
jgi:hypothetical protein